MDKHEAAQAILGAALPAIAFEGWRMRALEEAAPLAGYTREDCVRLFPGGIADALDAFARATDARMTEAYRALPAPERLHQRIAALLRLRIEAYGPHREAVRRALTLSALPAYAPYAVKSVARTVDEIWHLAGDNSADFSWYTKRFILAGVYTSTLLFWLNDESEGASESWAFLNRRLQDVLAFGRFKTKLRQALGG